MGYDEDEEIRREAKLRREGEIEAEQEAGLYDEDNNIVCFRKKSTPITMARLLGFRG